MSDVDQFLSGNSIAVKFPKEGYTVGGTVLGFEMKQQTHMEDGSLLVWADGKPRMQLVVQLQSEATGVTWETNAYKEVSIPDDDGLRTLYVKGSIQKAFMKALKDAGARIEVGGYIEVTRTKDGEPTKKGWGAPHNHKATWTPADKNSKAATDFVNSAEEEPPF
jgi:hypothetical protein